MFKSFKYRIYPNKAQRELFSKTFGCCRFVYNKTLEYKKTKYEEEKVSLSYFDCITYCNRVLKKDYVWLKEVDSRALNYAIKNMDDAYKKFFKLHTGYPRFKSKGENYKSYTTAISSKKNIVDFEHNTITLPKVGKVRAKVMKSFEGKAKSATVSLTPSGKYFVSVLVETEHIPLPKKNRKVAISFGLDNLVSMSSGKVYKNVKAYAKYEKKLVKLQRRLSRKQNGSKNYEKQRIKLARCHERIANVRSDALHKISYRIVRNNQVIYVDMPNVKEMIRKYPEKAKQLADASWYTLYKQFIYKTGWNHRSLIQISEQEALYGKCSVCENIESDVDRFSAVWICGQCGTEHDTGINFARNILRENIEQVE